MPLCLREMRLKHIKEKISEEIRKIPTENFLGLNLNSYDVYFREEREFYNLV